MTPRLSLTNPELVDYSGEHLLYEIQMFIWVSRTVPPMPTGPEKSVYLESFLIHLRNLIDFFYPQSPRPTDVIATDFYDDPAKWNATISSSLELARTRANKEVSHLTLGRKAGMHPDKHWAVLDLYQEMRTVAQAFAAGASTDTLSAKVVEWINLYFGVIAAIVVPGPMSNTTSVMTRSSVVAGVGKV